jgi:HAD superfamily hydrolase (TIGR01509 family)
MTMVSTRAVLFDFGGTLCSGNEAMERGLLRQAEQLVARYGLAVTPTTLMQACAAAFAQLLPSYVQQEFYLLAELNAAVFRQALAGLAITLTEAEALTLQQEWMGYVATELTLFEGVLETLATLRERGVTTGIVSLSDEAELQVCVAALGLADAVDVVPSTKAARSCKPQAGIFQQALRLAGCRAEEALFVGDMPPMDIAGANRVGMTSVLLQSATELAGRSGTAVLEGDLKPDYVIQSIPEVLSLLR